MPPKPEPPAIQVVFVSPGGAKTLGPLIKASNEPARTFDENAWDIERCKSEFRVFLRAHDSAGLEATMRAMDRLNCWVEVLNGLEPDKEHANLGDALLSFWIGYGFHIARSLKGDLAFVNALRRLLPAYGGRGLTLFRGELRSRYEQAVYGMAWTSLLTTAQTFANRRSPDEGDGVVLKIDASPEMIVAKVGGHLEAEEDEYILDPRLIADVVEID